MTAYKNTSKSIIKSTFKSTFKSFTAKLFISAGMIMATALLLTRCGSGTPEKKEVIRPVRTQTVTVTGGERERTFSGTVKSGQEAKISFKVAGTINQIHVKVGDRVKAGKLIAQLDKKDYRVEVQRAEASLDQARAQTLNARSAYERVRGLYENRNASKSELDSARAGYESSTASLRSLEKQLEMARLKLGYTQLYAPVNGSIARVSAEVNENVGAGTPVVVLTSGQKLEVQVAIPEMLIAGIREGDKAVVSAGALKGKTFDAVIKEVAVSSTGIGSTFPVTVQIQENAPGLRSGMTAEVTLHFKSAGKKTQKVIIVPTFAVGEDRQGRFVYTVKRLDDTYAAIERKPVKTGDITTGGIEILDGLTEGDQVVTAGISKITPGQKVKAPSGEREKQK